MIDDDERFKEYINSFTFPVESRKIDNGYELIIKGDIKVIDYIQRISEIESKITNIPDFIGSFEPLTQLTISYTNLTSIPESIGNLKNLKILTLSKNKLISLPESITKLENLEYLDLDTNYLQSLPNDIGKLKKLRFLRLNENQLTSTSIPKSVSLLDNLEDLYLRNNLLENLSFMENKSDMAILKKLKVLDVSSNHLKRLPDCIDEFQALTNLIARDNELTDLPAKIDRNKNLEAIDVKENQLVYLPKNIGRIVNLRLLIVSFNRLTDLPESIGNIENLRELHLRENRLTEIPKSLTNLTRLQYLDVSFNLFNHISDTLNYFIKKANQSEEFGKLVTQNSTFRSSAFERKLKLNITGNFFHLSKMKDNGIENLLSSLLRKLEYKQYISGSEWGILHSEFSLFWKEFWDDDKRKEKYYIIPPKSTYLGQVLRSFDTSHGGVIETFLNFLIGANNIDTGFLAKQEDNSYYLLNNEQVDLDPLWFVEIPLKLHFGEEFLKIRLNNLVNIGNPNSPDWMIGFPQSGIKDVSGNVMEYRESFAEYDVVNGVRKYYKPIHRIIVTIETPNFQRYTFDHFFEANSNEEFEHKKEIEELGSEGSAKQEVWLKDVMKIPLGNFTKTHDSFTFSYEIKLFFSNQSKPEINTPLKDYTIPIVKRRSYQKIEQIVKTYPLTLAIAIGIWGPLYAIYDILTRGLINIDFINSVFQSNIEIFLLASAMIGLPLFIIILVLFASIDKDKIKDRVILSNKEH